MNRRYHLFVIILTCLLFGWACQDDLPTSSQYSAEEDLTSNVIQLEESDGYLNLAGTTRSVQSLEILDGDFLTDMGKGRLYYEQNDNSSSRTARVRVTYSDGSDSIFHFSQPAFSRAYGSDMRQFYRHYGVGYSYNAVEGKYCNLNDFRCQILNRAILEQVEEEESVDLLVVNPLSEVSTSNAVYTSVVNYIQSASFDAKLSGTIVTFAGEAQANCTAFEEGIDELYILHDEFSKEAVEYRLSYLNIAHYAAQYPNLLTSSFRAALNKIKGDNKSIDDFVNVYGTHVVVYSKLGARMSLDIQVDTRRFIETDIMGVVAEGTLATMFKTASSTSESEKNYQMLKDSRCQFTVKGGDVSIFDNLVGISDFNNTSYTPQMKQDWLNSIKFDDDDIANSNVEMIDMLVAPIWEFIPDEALSRRVQARITGNLGLVIETLGNDNLINTSFPAHPESVTCKVGGVKKTFDYPSTVDVIAANRPIATICKERVPSICESSDVYVAYPIYEGYVKLTEGLCIYDKKAYRVNWSFNQFTATLIAEDIEDVDNIYMNAGALSIEPSDQLTYQDSHLILGCERPGGITIDGKVGGEMRPVHKYFGHFYLDNKTEYKNLPGWSMTTTLPDEAKIYKDYFTNDTYKNRMVRNEDYTYIWNKTEIDYE